jgi:hypothetical protein
LYRRPISVPSAREAVPPSDSTKLGFERTLAWMGGGGDDTGIRCGGAVSSAAGAPDPAEAFRAGDESTVIPANDLSDGSRPHDVQNAAPESSGVAQ